MSPLRQSRRFWPIRAESALPPIATEERTLPNVSNVPEAPNPLTVRCRILDNLLDSQPYHHKTKLLGVDDSGRPWRYMHGGHVSQLSQPSIAFQVVDHMPCKCGGMKWLMLIEPACAYPGAKTEPADSRDHDLRTFECPRCQQTETLVVRFK
jgi:hypothetical protein